MSKGGNNSYPIPWFTGLPGMGWNGAHRSGRWALTVRPHRETVKGPFLVGIAVKQDHTILLNPGRDRRIEGVGGAYRKCDDLQRYEVVP